MDQLDQIRGEFPVLKQKTYLNTASAGLLSQRVLDYRREYDSKYFNNGFDFRNKCLEETFGIKQTISRIFHCPPERIGLIPNFSWGMNGLAESLPQPSHVLLIDDDYPSLTLPFETRNFKTTYINAHFQNEISLLEEIEKINPDIFAVSNIQWKDGRCIPASTFKKIKETFPTMIIIADGTQFLGTCPFHFDESGIDFFLTSGYKWLLSGFGNGLIMMSKSIADQWQNKITGNNTVMDRFFTKRKNPGQEWEPGHLDLLNFGSMNISLQWLEHLGLDHIESQIKKLSLTLKTGLVTLGFASPQVLTERFHGNIMLIPGSLHIVKTLHQQGIEVAMRDGIRISIHFYNSRQDIQRFIETLKWIV